MEQDYVGYEYKEIIADSNIASFMIDGYENFGWEVDQNMLEQVMEQLPSGPTAYHKKTVIRLKRNRKIMNKVELTRLQRNFEALVNEIDKLEKSKSSTATMYALIVAITGTAFVAGSVFAVTATPPMIVLCILLAVPGFIGWVLPYFVYKKELQKKEEMVTELIEKKYNEIHEICEKGNKLLMKR